VGSIPDGLLGDGAAIGDGLMLYGLEGIPDWAFGTRARSEEGATVAVAAGRSTSIPDGPVGINVESKGATILKLSI
jgi:hypothetical protein